MAFRTQDVLLLETAEWPVSAAKCLGRQQATPADRSHPQGSERQRRTRHSAARAFVFSRKRLRRYGGLTAVGRRGAAAPESKPNRQAEAHAFPRTALRFAGRRS